MHNSTRKKRLYKLWVFVDMSGYFESKNMHRGLVPQGSASI